MTPITIDGEWLTIHRKGFGRYQPAGRYWTFQSFETATYLALALILTAISFWWVRRRLT